MDTSMRWRALCARARGKLGRTLLRAPVVRAWADWRHRRALAAYAPHIPNAQPRALVDTLRRDMVATMSGAVWLPPVVLTQTRAHCERLAEDRSARSTVELAAQALSPAVYTWGLAHANLDLAESYLGLPARYLGACIKREKADEGTNDVRQWHLDVEDRRMLKLIVYLDEVELDDGPFEYLEHDATLVATTRLRYRSGFVSDAKLASVVDRSLWRQVIGPALTVTAVDTCRLLHRARPPRRRDRYSVSFSYCSVRPQQLFPECLPARSFVDALARSLSSRQRAAALCA